MLKTILASVLLSLALTAAEPAAAQGLPGQFDGAHAPPRQGGAVTPQQFFLGTWAIETNLGAEIATYLPNGMVNGVVRLRKRPQPMPFQDSWSVRPLGGDRFELTVSAFGQRASNTLRMLPDGTLFNETARAIAYRVY